MGAKVGESQEGAISEINVTPLVDVMLVLLVVFMIASFAIQSGVAVQLPTAVTAHEQQDSGNHIIISVNDEGDIFVGKEQVSAENIIDVVNAEFRENPARSVLIKGAKDLHYGQVREVMDILAENGMTTLLLATEKTESGEG